MGLACLGTAVIGLRVDRTEAVIRALGVKESDGTAVSGYERAPRLSAGSQRVRCVCKPSLMNHLPESGFTGSAWIRVTAGA